MKAPNRPPSDYKTTVQLKEVSDNLIFHIMFYNLSAEYLSIFSAYRSTLNDKKLRGYIIMDLEVHFKQYEILYKYGKLKGWLDKPPVATPMDPETMEDRFMYIQILKGDQDALELHTRTAIKVINVGKNLFLHLWVAQLVCMGKIIGGCDSKTCVNRGRSVHRGRSSVNDRNFFICRTPGRLVDKT